MTDAAQRFAEALNDLAHEAGFTHFTLPPEAMPVIISVGSGLAMDGEEVRIEIVAAVPVEHAPWPGHGRPA